MYVHMYDSIYVPFCVRDKSLGARAIPAVSKRWKMCLLDFLMWLGVRVKESAQLAQCHSHIVSTYCMPDTQIYNVIVQDARVGDQVSYSTFRTWS